jgi:hypothetical protein
LRDEILARRAAHAGIQQADDRALAAARAAVAAVDAEIAATLAEKRDALRRLGFEVDAPARGSLLGSFGRTLPTLAEPFLAGNSQIVALQARRGELAAVPAPARAIENQAATRAAERRLRALLSPPAVRQTEPGFPLVWIDVPDPALGPSFVAYRQPQPTTGNARP